MAEAERRMQNRISSGLLKQRAHSKEEDSRGAYFRDTTAIIHSNPFRRLKHKTQVFFAPKNDHICTRIEHVMHVATIAASICKGLGLDDELAWAIGLGHDLGHTPFGHVGEEILSALNADRGGFIHELNSLRVVDYLADNGKGLNLTYAVRDGIVSHCGETFERFILPDERVKDLKAVTGRGGAPSTWEGAVVRAADKIAYLGRDYEDALKLKIISPDSLPVQAARTLGSTNREIINTLVQDVLKNSSVREGIGFSPEVFEALCTLKEHNYEKIYTSPLLAEYHSYFERMLRLVCDYFASLFRSCGFSLDGYRKEHNLPALRFGEYLLMMRSFYEEHEGDVDRAVIDYVAGMSDNYALDCVHAILQPQEMEDQLIRFQMEGGM